MEGVDYSVEHGFPAVKGTVAKCDFCPDYAYEGNLPPCVGGCHSGAIFYGDLNEDVVSNGKELKIFSETVEQESPYRYLEDLGTHPRVYYLHPRKRPDEQNHG